MLSLLYCGHNFELGKRRISATIEIWFCNSKAMNLFHERFECPIVKIIRPSKDPKEHTDNFHSDENYPAYILYRLSDSFIG